MESATMHGQIISVETRALREGMELMTLDLKLDKKVEPEYCFSVGLSLPGADPRRPYSPVRLNVAEQSIQLVIKVYPKEESRVKFTPVLREYAETGKILAAFFVSKAPIDPILAKYRKIFMISSGTGVTPMMQVLHRANEIRAADKSKNWLFFSASFDRFDENVILSQGLSAKEYPHLEVTVANLITSRLTRAHSMSMLKSMILGQVDGSPASSIFFLVCGTDGFVSSVAGERKGAFGGLLKALGIPQEQVHKF